MAGAIISVKKVDITRPKIIVQASGPQKMELSPPM
jgi:hypothetical protein